MLNQRFKNNNNLLDLFFGNDIVIDAMRLLFLLISIIFVAMGIFLYLPPDVLPLAGEGAMQAVSLKTGIAFPKVKVAFDIDKASGFLE